MDLQTESITYISFTTGSGTVISVRRYGATEPAMHSDGIGPRRYCGHNEAGSLTRIRAFFRRYPPLYACLYENYVNIMEHRCNVALVRPGADPHMDHSIATLRWCGTEWMKGGFRGYILLPLRPVPIGLPGGGNILRTYCLSAPDNGYMIPAIPLRRVCVSL